MKKVLSIVLALAMVFAFAACGEKKEETPVAPAKNTISLQIGQVISAAHGNKCFTVTTAVVAGDKIVKAFIDEYQFLNPTSQGVTAVPNATDAAGLGQYFVDAANVFASKRDSNAYYSENMKNKGNATQEYVVNMDALQAFCEGKTIAELGKVDAVSGCTFSDPSGYVKSVADAATAAQKNEAVTYEYEGDLNVKLNMINAAAHGNKCFTIAAALSDGTTVILSYVDEFQFMADGAEGVVAVPNSDQFAASIQDGQVLASKRLSNAYYSNNMKNKGNATQEYVVNMDALQKFCNGKTIAELEKADAVSGCTFTDPTGYVKAIAQAAK